IGNTSISKEPRALYLFYQ
ncbi:putative lipoprotein, partial [Chlamydia psittaci 03DC29]